MPRRRHPGEGETAGRHKAGWPRRGQGWRSQRGAALVEAAFVLPVVIVLLFGVVEYGFVFKDELTISNAVRAGARVGAADGRLATANVTSADYDIVMAVKSGASALNTNSIQKVIVYKASTSAAKVTDTTCDQTNGTTGVCNVYSGAFVNAAIDQTKFGCGTGSVDSKWCPSSRIDTQAFAGDASNPPGPSYVGVYIEINHNYLTKMFGQSRIMRDQAISRVEPQS